MPCINVLAFPFQLRATVGQESSEERIGEIVVAAPGADGVQEQYEEGGADRVKPQRKCRRFLSLHAVSLFIPFFHLFVMHRGDGRLTTGIGSE